MSRPGPSRSSLKLTAYFGERQRVAQDGRRPGFLADAMLDLFDRKDIATSVMLRGIASFGPRHVLRTDQSLSLSEDPPVAVTAVDVEPKIIGLVDDVLALTGRGLVTLERAGRVDSGNFPAGAGDAVKLTVYIGRQERVSGQPAHRAVCDLLRRHQFSGATAFLGVDGTARGTRYRAAFFSRNVNVPLMVVAIGTPAQASAAVAELGALAPGALMTIEQVRQCKREGRLLDRPHRLPDTDGQGRPLWQQLTVHTSGSTTSAGAPIHRALVSRLLESGTAHGVTVLRGIWGFDGDRNPNGDKLFQLTRRTPVVTTIIDTPERIAQSFDIVDELTAQHGLVTSEMIPAAVTVDGPHRDGGTELADHAC
ncbi:DUF190 domain-containing protein [Mycobacterium sp.]|uniref:DUF190 domain-containing protein n=1 Tax=Mycobacterium sp. TaxID=1785 RepID=UPI0025D6C3F5|nr:DUF190 domain-containing protein [Mycobacterium sp.]